MDNIYHSKMCPQKGGHIRFMTTYKAIESTDQNLQKELNINRNEHDYRKKLQSSGIEILDKKARDLHSSNMCKF